MFIHAGETLRLTLSGKSMTFPFPGAVPMESRNKGKHIIHTGEKYPSRLILPLTNEPSITAPNYHNIQQKTIDSNLADKSAPFVDIETSVSLEGTWELTIKTPIGKQHPMIMFSSSGNMVQGVIRNSETGEEMPLTDIVFNGNQVTWSQEVTKPIRGKSSFVMQVNGNSMSGKVKMSGMPIKVEVTAKRIN